MVNSYPNTGSGSVVCAHSDSWQTCESLADPHTPYRTSGEARGYPIESPEIKFKSWSGPDFGSINRIDESESKQASLSSLQSQRQACPRSIGWRSASRISGKQRFSAWLGVEGNNGQAVESDRRRKRTSKQRYFLRHGRPRLCRWRIERQFRENSGPP